MLVNCIRYTIDPTKSAAFAAYAKGWTEVIARTEGVRLIGYFLPTRIAGPTNTAYALIGFDDLAAYARYRETILTDEVGRKLFDDADRDGFILNEERSFLQQVLPTGQ